MDFHPKFVFRNATTTELTLKSSLEASQLAKAYRARSAAAHSMKTDEKVKEEARARIVEAGGDPGCWQLVLSESKLQFGQYRGQTFKWLLSNDVGYACCTLALHQKERDSGETSQSPLAANKDALASYAQLFPEMVAAIHDRAVQMGILGIQAMDNRMVGFGVYAKETYRSLYENPSREHQTYLQWVRRQQVNKGSLMHTLQQYAIGRDNEAKERRSSSQEEPSDAMLLEALEEVESQSSTSQTMVTPPPPPPPPPEAEAEAEARPHSAAGHSSTSHLTSGAELLPKSWRQTLPEDHHDWVGRALFVRGPKGKAVLTSKLQLWWYPPTTPIYFTQPPASPSAFFYMRLFLWCPYKMWGYKLLCPTCKRRLTGGGLYKTVRKVLDISSWYLMATEYLECHTCKKKFASWAPALLDQMDMAHREKFPAILTYKLSCDKSLVAHLKARTLGNSTTRLHSTLLEEHTRKWACQSIEYLAVMKQFSCAGTFLLPKVAVPPMCQLPSVSWLLSVYVREVLPRLEDTKARITSTFGQILKMDSTKKMTKKLAGEAAGTAAWVTNVGNEYGQVLMSVLTAAEGDGLVAMADGLIRRYREARQDPPQVLYVDRDCCATGPSKVAAMFGEWEQLVVRLDVWHLMRRFARGVTTDAHILYATFMARLSFAIFEWDEGDVTRLREAKQAEAGHRHSSYVKLSARELSRHCRRRTRGAEETERLIQEVLDHFWEAKDTMGVTLFNKESMTEIWETQRRHLHCIQDPPGVALYTRTGKVTRGGVTLPVLRCARGSTSLESFHLHLCRFIPGTSANALHFQVYLLEGLLRWNEDRGRAAVVESASTATVRCYDGRLQNAFHELTQHFMGCTLMDNFTPAGNYTGELIGIEYLYSQTGRVLQCNVSTDPDCPEVASSQVDEEDDTDVDELDEGYEEAALGDVLYAAELPAWFDNTQHITAPVEEEDVLGPDGHGGYQHVCRLAAALLQLRTALFVSPPQERTIVQLWGKMSDRDRAPIDFPPLYRPKLVKGRFKKSRQHLLPGVDSVNRLVVGKGTDVAHCPSSSRLMEAIFIELCNLHSQGHNIAGFRINRWGLVMQDYNRIKSHVRMNRVITAAGPIQLLEVNHRTLTNWYNKRSKAELVDTVVASVPLPSAERTVGEQLLAVKEKMVAVEQPRKPFDYQHPADNSGLAATRRGPVVPELYAVRQTASTSAAASASTAAPAAPCAASAAPSTSAVTSTSSAASSAAEASAPASSARVSSSTAWSRKKRELELERAYSLGQLFLKKTPRKMEHFRCKLCGFPKNKEHGHSRYRNEHFCSRSEGRSVDDWLNEKRSQDNQRKTQTKQTKETVHLRPLKPRSPPESGL
ncbi:uncharacterized protein LOC129187709 isoform X2 [Dunckerocampus dactyliophorus]|uniref:uncharacterized protein LOC129187709 isoform X2 n=1 Tax=Dunckerocampus dactyliophorus TaxID=161453 RepID=UPI00240675E5|nr:uncharacterized protein LOC129187709 isoform X2 [Dunckerocampus dactyliophorus]